MVDRIRWDTVSYLPFYYFFFQFLLLTIFNLQANILTTKDILSNLDFFDDLLNIGPLPPPLKSPILHGSPIVVFYKKWWKNQISNADRQKPMSDS